MATLCGNKQVLCDIFQHVLTTADPP